MMQCKVCKTTIEPTTKNTKADYYLCRRHAMTLDDSPSARELMRAVAGDVARGQVEQNVDINGCRFFRRLPPKPPRRGVVSYDDDGFERHCEPGSIHGQTVRPETDRIYGGTDPRLDQYREQDAPKKGGGDDAA